MFLLVAGLAPSAWSVQPAHAKPTATLGATPSPVVIPVDKTSGIYELTWDTGGDPAQLWVTVNNTQPGGNSPVSGSGSATKKIKFGDTHRWTLYTPAGTQLATVKVTTRRPTHWCEGECIKLVKVVPHGTFANFKIVPMESVKLDVAVHEYNQGNTAVAGTKFHVPFAELDLLPLKPHTQYFYLVTATDETGNVQEKTGSFKTLRRKVDVNIESIKVVDDSDELSAGDLTFWFNTNGEWDFVDTYGEVSVSSGDTAHPNHAISIIDAPPTLSLGVYGRDDDCGPTSLCEGGIGPGGDDGGSNDEADWATAFGSANVEVVGPTESFSSSFSFKATDWELEFKVHATFTVSYV